MHSSLDLDRGRNFEMKRCQTSSNIVSAPRSIFPRNGGNGLLGCSSSIGATAGYSSCGGLLRPTNNTRRPPRQTTGMGGTNAGGTMGRSAAAVGRSLLDRPKLNGWREGAAGEGDIRKNDDVICIPDALLIDATFTKSAAESPIRRTSTDKSIKSLKPCLSSSSMLSRTRSMHSKSSANGFGSSGQKNEEFNLVRNVCFSHEQVREYEVTLGDNPSVSSGAPLSLGWRYNPKESFSPIQPANDEKGSEISSSLRIGGINVINNNNNRIRRSRSELKLSDRERHRRLSANPNVSMEDLHSVLQQVAQVKLGRKESLNEVREQMAKERKARYDALLEERALMLRRRMGIVDGGGGVSKSIWIQER